MRKDVSAQEVSTALTACLEELHLPTMQAEFAALALEAQQESLSYPSYVLELAERECQQRRQKRTERLLKDSRLPLAKNLPTFDLKRLPAKVVQQVRTLVTGELVTGEFVQRQENVLLFGPPGSGKTHCCCAVGQELVRAGQRVLFTKCNALVQTLLVAKRDLTIKTVLRRLTSWDVLIIDDLGYVQQSREEMEVLFTLLAERYELGSVMVTSNLAFSQWEQIFKDPMTTAAAIDRLVHHCTIVELNVPSYRMETAKKARQSQT